MKRGRSRATRKIPAATIVAAWIRAEIGVGPSIAFGNHACEYRLFRCLSVVVYNRFTY